MVRLIVARVLLAIPMLLVISFLAFVLINLSPLDPAVVVLHAQGVPTITEALVAETNAALGLDRPFLIRYVHWATACLRLDFGLSYVTGIPVWTMLGPALANTLKLTMVSVIAMLALSIGLGAACALREGKRTDKAIRGAAFFLTALPSYLLAALLTWLFAVKLDLLPTSGMDGLGSFVLPAAVIAVGYAGTYFRFIRSAMLSQLHEDYVLYARASGLPETKVVLRIGRNAMQTAIAVFCMAIPTILGSTVVVENVFAWPGAGTLGVRAVLGRDYPVIQAYVLVMAAAFVAFNTVADILNAALNPRLRNDP